MKALPLLAIAFSLLLAACAAPLAPPFSSPVATARPPAATNPPPVTAPAPIVAPAPASTAQPTIGFDGGPAGGPPQPRLTVIVRNLEGSLIVQGLARTYRLHLPPSFAPATRPPLVIALHAQGQTSAELARVSQFDDVADREGFLVAYPDGTGSVPGWNAGDCCGEAQAQKVDDVAFVSALIDALQGAYRVDPARVFVMGYAEGGMLAQRLAVDLSGKVAAIAVLAARLPASLPAPSRPLPVLLMHGTADPQLPAEAASALLAFWTQSDGCASEPQRQGTAAFYRETYACYSVRVVRYIIDGGGHTWPQTTPAAASLIWLFFAGG